MCFSHDFKDVKTENTSSFLGCFFGVTGKGRIAATSNWLTLGLLEVVNFFTWICLRCFFYFLPWQITMKKTPLGGICLELFPSIEQTNPSFVWRDRLLDGLPWCYYTRMILTRIFASWVWYGNFRVGSPEKKSRSCKESCPIYRSVRFIGERCGGCGGWVAVRFPWMMIPVR